MRGPSPERWRWLATMLDSVVKFWNRYCARRCEFSAFGECSANTTATGRRESRLFRFVGILCTSRTATASSQTRCSMQLETRSTPKQSTGCCALRRSCFSQAAIPPNSGFARDARGATCTTLRACAPTASEVWAALSPSTVSTTTTASLHAHRVAHSGFTARN